MTRDAYLVRSKEQAFKHLDNGNADAAYNSIMNALKNHAETSKHMAIELGQMMKGKGLLDDVPTMREFIKGIK